MEEPQLTHLYPQLAYKGKSTVQDIINELKLPPETAYSYVNRLNDTDVIKITQEKQPLQYTAHEINQTVTTATGNRKYTITPALSRHPVVANTTTTTRPTSTATVSPASPQHSPTPSPANEARLPTTR